MKNTFIARLAAIASAILLLLPLNANAVNITVPSAPGAGYALLSTTTGAYNYVATSSLGIITRPGGLNLQVQYNNGGVFGGISGAVTNGTILNLTNPLIGGATITTSTLNGVTLTTGGSANSYLNGAGAYSAPITAKVCTAGDFVSTISAAGIFTCTTPSGGGSTGLATSSPIANSNVLIYSSTGAGSAYGVATSTPTLSSELTYGGTLGSFVGGTSGALSLTTNGTALSKLAQIAANTVLGNPTGVTGNVQAFATSSLGIAISDTTGTLLVARGGTGSTTLSGILKGNGTSMVGTAVANTDYQIPITLTTTGSSGAATFNGTTLNVPQYSGTTYTGTFPISVSGSVISFGGLSTSTAAVVGNIPYFSGMNTFANVATSTLTATSPLTGSFTHIGTTGTLGCQTASGSQAGCLSSADWTTFNSKIGAAITSIGPTGQTQTGPAVIFATSTAAFNGLTSNLTITGSTNTITFAPTLSGTLGVGGGGTGQTTFTSGNLLYGNGSGAIQNVATTTLVAGTNISFSGGTPVIVGSSPVTINGTGATFSGTVGQVDYFTGTNTAAGTSTIIIATNGSVGVGSTTPGATLSVNGKAAGTVNVLDVATSTAGFATSSALRVDQNGNVSVRNGASLTVTARAAAAGAFAAFDPSGTLIATSSPAAAGTDLQTFTSTAGGTWTKPSGLTGNEVCVIQVWGSGGSGGGGNNADGSIKGGGGGGGGGFASLVVPCSALTGTVAVTVGTGATGGAYQTGGNPGNPSSFGSYVSAFGGGGGSSRAGNTGVTSGGGGGGGILSAGSNASAATGGTGGAPGGGTSAAFPSSDSGGAGGANLTAIQSSFYGGAGGGSTNQNGGNSIYGGGGGAAGSGPGVAGTSQFGGAGAAQPAGGANGNTGNQPAGGGSGGNGLNATGGAGGAGEVRVFVVRS